MNFRRVRDHVKAQNWAAVVIDFVIVVVGILIAFQITEWNQARVDRMKEGVYLARLDAEMDVILERLETGVHVARQSSEAAELLLATRAGRSSGTNETGASDDDLRAALRLLRAGRVPAGSPAAFRQMVSSGELTLLRNDDLRNALFAYDEFATIARDVWRGGWDEFLVGYQRIAPLITADVDFDRPLPETYAVADFDREAFFNDEGLDGALEMVLAAKVNHYEVMQLQLSLAREIDGIIEGERAS